MTCGNELNDYFYELTTKKSKINWNLKLSYYLSRLANWPISTVHWLQTKSIPKISFYCDNLLVQRNAYIFVEFKYFGKLDISQLQGVIIFYSFYNKIFIMFPRCLISMNTYCSFNVIHLYISAHFHPLSCSQ